MVFYGVLFSVCAVVVYLLFGRKLFAIFQQCGYKPKDFFSALKEECQKEIERLSTYSLTFFVYLLVFSIVFPLSAKAYAFIFSGASVLFPAVVFARSKPTKGAKLTARFLRMCFASCLAVFGASFAVLAAAYNVFGAELPICIVVSSTLFLIAFAEPVIMSFGYYVFLPYDKIVFSISVKKCKKRLEKFPKLVKIGITGSYGKTTVKNTLSEMLSEKYKVVKTPLSYNTPLGLCIAAKEITSDTEFFVAELGARKRGDIKELCDILKPDVGVITGICPQHMETFLTMENLKKTKNELIESLGVCGYAFFGGDSEGSRELYEKCTVNKFIAGKNGGFVYGKTLYGDEDGAVIEITMNGKTYTARTKLLGEHNVGNICLAAAVALKSGVKEERIVLAIGRLKPEKHRLEPIKSDGIIVLDDSYNANIESAKAAAEVLKGFVGRKFVVTPGIVEGGKESAEINKSLGQILSGVADEIVAVGRNAPEIFEGVTDDVGFFSVKNLEEAKKILYSKIKTGDVVLFLSDVPDKYGV